MLKRTPSRLVIAALALVAAAATLGVQPAAAVSDGEIEITVTDAGDPATAIELRVAPDVGDVATLMTRVDSEMHTGDDVEDTMPPFTSSEEYSQTLEIVDVADDGAYSANSTLTTYTADSSLVGESSEFGLGLIVDVPLVIKFDPERRIVGIEPQDDSVVSEDQLGSIDTLAASGNILAVVVPESAVGVGAIWSANIPTSMDDEQLPLEVTFELVTLEDGSYTIDVESHVDTEAMSESVTLPPEMEGFETVWDVTGTISGRIDETLESTTRL
ncbi:MAG: hypothetical protein M3431_04845, partial [Actinomycetota bacterium]|nr:hypothetical protein [Actinomycetota bacterium]